MPLYSDFGNVLVMDEEFQEMQASQPDMVRDFFGQSSDVNRLEFSTGPVDYEEWKQASDGSFVPFTPVGINKPLTISIRYVYTGNNPKRGKRDMLFTSAVRGITSQLPAPRAINFLEREVEKNTALPTVAATDYGTPLIYYSPAQMEGSLTLTLEFGFDSLLDDSFNMLARAFGIAAAIPIFVTQQYHLLMALGQIAKVSEKVAKQFGNHVDFKETVQLNFNMPGPLATAQSLLVTSKDFPTEELRELHINAQGCCVYEDGMPYEGEHPYVVIALDGAQRDEFRDFSAVYASAALLEQFFGNQEGEVGELGPIMDALRVYSDWEWRRRADEISQALDQLDEDSPEFKKKREEYNAAVSHISDALLKP